MTSEELDRILDDALASYSLQEARPGLSGRVMARVYADRARLQWGWWSLALVAGTLACAAIAVLWWPREVSPPTVAWSPPAAALKMEPVPRAVAADFPRRSLSVQAPRRERFPASAAMTSEERLLVAFTQTAPDAALQFAQPAKPIEIEPIEIQPLRTDGLSTGETK